MSETDTQNQQDQQGTETDPQQTPATETDASATQTQEPDYKAEAEKWKSLARKNEQQAKANAAAAQKLQQFEDANKSEQQRLEERAAAAERTAAEQSLALARYEVAAAKAIPSDWIEFLHGATPEELEQNADKLKERIGTVAQAPHVPDFDAGARPPAADGGDMNSLIRQSAGRPA